MPVQSSKKVRTGKVNGFYLEKINTVYQHDANEELFEQLAGAQSKEEKEDITEKIIKNNKGFIHFIIKGRFDLNAMNLEHFCQVYRITPDEVFAELTFGLYKAIRTYKKETGFKFATYASRVLHNEIGMMIRRMKKERVDLSLDTGYYRKEQEGHRKMTLGEIIEDEFDPINDFIEEEMSIQLLEQLQRKLKPTEAKVIKAYIESNGEGKQKEIANVLGISQSYVSRVVKNTIEKARVLYQQQNV